MGNCKLCGQSAGFLRSVHKECENSYENGKKAIIEILKTALTSNVDFNTIDLPINTLTSSSFIDKDEIGSLCRVSLDSALDIFLEDGVISDEEEQRVLNFQNHFNLNNSILDENGALQKMAKGRILKEIMDGNLPKTRIKISGNLPFVLKKGEEIIWFFNNVELHENRIKTTIVGKSKGVSIRIAKGLYYRAGSFKGNPVKSEQLMHLANGIFAITNQNIFFSSANKNLKIPLNEVINIDPYSDGIGIQKEGANAKNQIFKNLDGWFIYNLISNLAKL